MLLPKINPNVPNPNHYADMTEKMEWTAKLQDTAAHYHWYEGMLLLKINPSVRDPNESTMS